jgi:hypothetical protein
MEVEVEALKCREVAWLDIKVVPPSSHSWKVICSYRIIKDLNFRSFIIEDKK